MTSQPAANQDPASPKRTPAVVYIVDDEPMLVDLAEMILKPEGHVIKKFYGPEQALKSFMADCDSPTLLITDYAMGAMSGVDLAAACKRKHPELKIIILSGTGGPDIGDAPVKIDHFIAKPYETSMLLETVRSLLPKHR